jgi:stearoyl-CoA 9-desaturase NADPH oxidoreductase
MTVLNAFSFIRTQFDKSIFNTEASAYFEPLVEKYLPGKSLTGNKAKVSSIVKETEDTIAITLQPSTKWKGFTPGQYLQLGVKINAVWYYRAFSIASSLHQFKQEGTIRLCIQKQENGKVTPWLFDQLQAGDFVTVSEAKGSFSLSENAQAALFIAGGTGITPFISMLHAAAEKQQNLVLLYYAKSQRHILKAELEALNAFDNLEIHLLTSTEQGRFCKEHLHTLCPDFQNRNILICGPAGMIEDGCQILETENVPQKNIAYEYFKSANFKLSKTGESIPSTIHVKGKSITANSQLSILSQLESAGIQPKYGCRMGICKQCQCLKTSGIVFNQLTGKYSEPTEEPIQICVSTPVGEVNIDL